MVKTKQCNQNEVLASQKIIQLQNDKIKRIIKIIIII